MNISIITMHAMHNPGSVYQAYALQTFLQEKGHKVKVIDYRPQYFYTEGSRLNLMLKKILFFSSYRATNRKYSNFISDNISLTKRYDTFEELMKGDFSSDLYLVGSDQLWNTDYECGNDKAYYLQFITKGIKASYSTSVGKEVIDKENLSVLMSNLSGFNLLSVREKTTAEQLRHLLNKEVKWVCDPVFLLRPENYKRFIGESKEKVPYVMVYISPSSKELDEIVEFFHNKGYKVILFGGYTKRCKCDEHIKIAGPADFLTCLYNADYVVSSSFHATAFCHIFHKQFVTIIPQKNGERMKSLLRESKLLSRAVEKDSVIDYNAITEEVNWSRIDKNLEAYIIGSKEYLDKVVRTCSY